MGISVSLVLIAVGAILTWAVTTTVSGIDLNVVGVILIIGGLTFFPALALGPVVEHLAGNANTLF